MSEKITVAIADDHEIFRGGLIRILEQFDMFEVVIEASDGLELIQKIEAQTYPPDICLLDISMPRMNGYETLAELKKRWPFIRVIILTVSYTEYTIIKTLTGGASACLPKEIDHTELVNAIEHVCNFGLYHTDMDTKFLSKSQVEKNRKIKLSAKELRYLQLACSSMTHREIAKILKVSDRTVDSYRDILCDKLNLKNRIELVIFTIESGLRSPDILNQVEPKQ